MAATRWTAREDVCVPEWDFEIEVGEDLARALIADQFPYLEVTFLRRVGEGWDNTVWATSEDIVFRFPRRAIAIPGVQRDMAVLPGLARQLPASIPNAAYAGAPSARFPWPWFASRLINGVEIALADLASERRGQHVAELGVFLTTSHADGRPSALVDHCSKAVADRSSSNAPHGVIVLAWIRSTSGGTCLTAGGET